MSTAEILSLVSLISYIAAGVFLGLAIVFWFIFKIPVVIGNLSGRTAKKSIEQMRRVNTQSGSKSYRSSTTNAARGKLTDAMPQTSVPTPIMETPSPETCPLTDQQPPAPYSAETVPLYSGEATTTLLDEGATTPLDMPAPVADVPFGAKKLTMLNEVMLIHTDEVI